MHEDVVKNYLCMELKDFVKETLVQIAQGIKEAQGEYNELGGLVNPGQVKDAGNIPYIKYSNYGSQILASCVDFDVVISDAEVKETDGQAKACLGVFSLGGSRTASGNHAELSKVHFSVPVILPPHLPSHGKTE